MGRPNAAIPSVPSTSKSSPAYTPQALTLYSGMGGPHPSTTQTIQSINATGEIADQQHRDSLSAYATSSSGPVGPPGCRPSPEPSISSHSGSSAPTPLQYSPSIPSLHAQAQGLHRGMACVPLNLSQPKPRHRMEPVRLSEAGGLRTRADGESREWALCGLCVP